MNFTRIRAADVAGRHWLAVGMGCLVAASAMAESTDGGNAGEHQLEEIIVTSQKREERLQDVPVPVTALTASALADKNNFRLQDYYSQVPGLSLTPNEYGGEPTIAIRGITSGDFNNPTVAITVDDVPFGASTATGGGYFAPDLDPSDLARIEVLRGPQGTLYGAASMGGLVKYVTVDPSTDALTGRVQTGLVHVDDGGQTGYNISAAVNVPAGDAFAVRASGFTRRDPGYIDNIQSGERDVNKTEVAGAHLSSLWRPSTSFSLKLSALYQHNKLFGSPYVTVAPGVGDLQQRFLPRTGEVDRKFMAYSATATAKLGAFDLTSVTGYGVNQLHDVLDETELLGALTSVVFPTGYTINTDTTRTRKFSQEMRLATSIGEHFDWLVGGFYTYESSPFAIEYIPTDANSERLGSFALFEFTSTYGEWAAFTDLTYRVTDQFDVQFGGRQSRIRQTYEGIDSGPYVLPFEGVPSPAVTPEIRVHQSAFTYLVTPRWKITPDLMFYARLASGFRPGGINQGDLIDHPYFDPDKTQNYEIGIKGSTLDHKLSFDASLYYIGWKDIQLTLTNPNTSLNYFSNGSAAKSEGVEFSMQATPLSGLRIGGWVSWNNAILTQDLPPGSTAYGVAGDHLPYSSRFSANASMDYEFPLDRFIALFGGTVSYVGNRIGAFQLAPQDPSQEPSVRQDLPAYTQIDLRTEIKLKDWTANLYLNNATDKRGVVGGGLATAFPTSFGLIQPRTIGLSIARSF